MSRKGKIILAVLLCLSVSFLVIYVVVHSQKESGLSAQLKADIVSEYEKFYPTASYQPIVWYDENGGVEEEGVWRYVGTYGDCVAMLRIEDGYVSLSDLPVPLPLRVMSNPRPVHYHCECTVQIYNTKQATEDGSKLAPLHVDGVEGWLSDEQYAQLADDIEAISGNNVSQTEKDKIEKLYAEALFEDSVLSEQQPIVWYDENGYVEEPGVWRYIGNYSSVLHAFLRIGDNKDEDNNDIEQPYPIAGLPDTVHYPVEAEVILYRVNREFSYSEVCGSDLKGKISIWPLSDIDNLNEWLPYQHELDLLTQDLKAISEVN